MRAIATSPMNFCAALDELGAATWLEIEQGRRTRHPLEEEAITSYHLMRLAAAVPSVRLEKHTKRREAKSGADWEIWAGRSGALLGLRVQAKMLKCDTSAPEYKALYSSKATATRQIEKLIRSAEAAKPRMYPVVVFYNSLPSQSDEFSAIPCSRLANAPLLCGWTVASAYVLRDRLANEPSKLLCDLVDVMLPLSCLFCCPRSCPMSLGTEDRLAERLARQLARAWPREEIAPAELIRPGPVYAERLYKGESAQSGWDFVPREFRRLMTADREIPKDVSRVLVIRDDG